MHTQFVPFQTRRFIAAWFVLICLSLPANAGREKLLMLQNLKGPWAFSIGINEEWFSTKYDDSGWESIKVPSPWENQGFNGYNGYAFYRKKTVISSAHKGRMLYLYLGYIDDVDEVRVNGHKVGSAGGFPPHYATAYNAERIYYLPEEVIRFDAQNLIAVKVYDSYDAGGIISGEIGIYGGSSVISFDVNLQTTWKFQTGDDLRRREPGFDDRAWDDVLVPSRWEDQGYRDYDGYGWYRKSFVFNGNPSDKYVLLAGRIDDIDQVFVNGVLVGSTGNFPPNGSTRTYVSQEYKALRGYYLPEGLLRKGQRNTIAVRVLDTGGEGGIWEGPVGLLTQSAYIEYWKKNKNFQR